MALTDNFVWGSHADEASGTLLDVLSANDFTDTGGVGAASGKLAGARDYTGAVRHEHASNAALTTGDIDFSIALWLNADVVNSGFPGLFCKHDGAGVDVEFNMLIDGSSSKVEFAVYPTGANGSVVIVQASTFGALSTGTWYFVACGHNATLNDIWISVNAGTPDTVSHSTGTHQGSQVVTVGALGTTGNFFDGRIDEIGFWKRDIRSDLAALYASGAGLAYPFSGGIARRRTSDAGGSRLVRQMVSGRVA